MEEQEFSKIIFELENQTDENKFLKQIGKLIDLAAEGQSTQRIPKWIDILDDWIKKIPESNNKAKGHYYLANAWGVKIHGEMAKVGKGWNWQQKEAEKEIINLRLAERLLKEFNGENELRCRVLTNLANIYDILGRPFKALYYWNKVISLNDRFGFAIANKGRCLVYHGVNSVPGEYCYTFYIQTGYKYLKESLRCSLTDELRQTVLKDVSDIEKSFSGLLNVGFEPAKIEYEADKDYTKWCIDETLLLNPLIDIHPYEQATSDDALLFLSDTGMNNLFTQIKQEFRLARYLLFKSKSIDSQRNGFDKATEYKKMSFRVLYSLFDKVTYLINQYYSVGVSYKQVNFRTMWFEKNGEFRSVFKNSKNLALRGIYWISKDLFYESSEHPFKEVPADDTHNIYNLRNYLEHKSFVIGEPAKIDFTFQIPEADFNEKIIDLMRLARECIIYFSFTVRWKIKNEEQIS